MSLSSICLALTLIRLTLQARNLFIRLYNFCSIFLSLYKAYIVWCCKTTPTRFPTFLSHLQFPDMASTPLKLGPKMRRENRGSLQSDDTALVRQIRETHVPGRSHIVDVKPILHVTDEIFHRSSVVTDGGILLVISCPI